MIDIVEIMTARKASGDVRVSQVHETKASRKTCDHRGVISVVTIVPDTVEKQQVE